MATLNDPSITLGSCNPISEVSEISPASDYGVPLGMPTGPTMPPLCYDLTSASDESPTNSRSEISEPKASDRESRIRAEKQRRSQYNMLIKELTSILPATLNSQRKIDKTSVLRLAANELRNIHVFGDSIKCCHLENWSKFINVPEIFGGFLITMTCLGRVLHVSPNIQNKLGYCHIDLLGTKIYEYVHPEDHKTLSNHIYPDDLKNGTNKKIFEEHHDFHIRIKRCGAKSDPPRYMKCRIDGKLRRSDHATANRVQVEHIKVRQRVRHNRTFHSSGNDFVFIGMVRIEAHPMPVQMPLPTAYTEYWTRHLIDGRIVQVDQSISLVAGYMTEEVTGTSAFSFMHKDDVRWVVCVLRQMYDQSKEFGESYYRLMSRNGNFIYMRTRGFLEIDKNTKQVQSFVCVNSVIEDKHGKEMMDEMKRKYSVLVDVSKTNDVKPVTRDDAPVEHPQSLEGILLLLVQPSQSSNNESVEPLKIVPPSKDTIRDAIKNSEKLVCDTVRFEHRKRKTSDLLVDKNNEQCKRQNNSGVQK